MANFFSLNDGILTDSSVYGYSISAAEVTNNTTGIWLSTGDAYSPSFICDGSAISAVAVHLSARVANPTSSVLTLKLSSASSVITETYPISSFTSFDGSRNLLTNYPQNWQLLKLTNTYTVPNLSSARLSLATSVSSTLAVMGNIASNNYDKLILKNSVVAPSATDTIHIGGALKSSTVEPRTITANTITTNNIYVHNKGTLTFPTNTSKTLTLNGSAGIQITSDGTMNIGTSGNVIPSNITHTIVLSNTQIDIHDGGTLNAFGYPKTLTTNLVSDMTSLSDTFIITDSVSTSWLAGDTLIFKPNLVDKTGFDILILSSFPLSNRIKTTTSSTYTHTGSSTYSYVPTIYNATRNVNIQGLSPTIRSSVRTINAANLNLSYVQLSNFGIATQNKTGFVLGNNSSGNTYFNGIVINGDTTAGLLNITPLTGRTFSNVNIGNSIFIKSSGLILSSLSASNFSFNGNYILNPSTNGMVMSSVSGSMSFNGNVTIGTTGYGTLLNNNLINGSYGLLGYNCSLQGMMLSGYNTGTVVGGGINSTKEGVWVSANLYNLSGLSFQNIIACKNDAGFRIANNNTSIYTTPVFVNINGLNACDNNTYGFVAYNMCGNVNTLSTVNNATDAIKISIGNNNTVFDSVTSVTNGTAFNVVSSINYGQTVIKNAFLSSSSVALNITTDKLEDFRLEGSTLSASVPFQLSSIRAKIEGSYTFSNSNSDVYGLSSTVLTGYQSEVFNETGFSVMNENKIETKKYRMLAAGRISYDTTQLHTVSSIASEKLEPMSTTTKLRSSSKYIPVNAGDSLTVSVYVHKSAGYTGSAPRLILKRNAALGITETVLHTHTEANGIWTPMSGATGISQDTGIIEVYVDCSGSIGSGSINIDDWNFS